MIKKNKLGFTLLEIMIVIAILAVVIGVSAVNYKGYKARADLSSATDKLEADIMMAQQMGISNPNANLAANIGSPVDYVVNIESTKYTIYAVSTSHIIKEVAFIHGISANSATLVFRQSGSLVSPASPVTVTVTNANAGNANKRITINQKLIKQEKN